MIVHTCNPTTEEAETEEHCRLEVHLGSTVRPAWTTVHHAVQNNNNKNTIASQPFVQDHVHNFSSALILSQMCSETGVSIVEPGPSLGPLPTPLRFHVQIVESYK